MPTYVPRNSLFVRRLRAMFAMDVSPFTTFNVYEQIDDNRLTQPPSFATLVVIVATWASGPTAVPLLEGWEVEWSHERTFELGQDRYVWVFEGTTEDATRDPGLLEITFATPQIAGLCDAYALSSTPITGEITGEFTTTTVYDDGSVPSRRLRRVYEQGVGDDEVPNLPEGTDIVFGVVVGFARELYNPRAFLLSADAGPDTSSEPFDSLWTLKTELQPIPGSEELAFFMHSQVPGFPDPQVVITSQGVMTPGFLDHRPGQTKWFDPREVTDNQAFPSYPPPDGVGATSAPTPWVLVGFGFFGVPWLRQKQRDDAAPRAANRNAPTSVQAGTRASNRNRYV